MEVTNGSGCQFTEFSSRMEIVQVEEVRDDGTIMPIEGLPSSSESSTGAQ